MRSWGSPRRQRRVIVQRVRTRSAESGFSLLEVVVATSLIVVGLAALSGSIVSGSKLSRSKRDSGLAQQAARQFLEELQGETFGEIFARYNSSPDDDPGGAGTAPGPGFAVSGLTPQIGDADGLVGRIEFPTVRAGLIDELREDVADAALGMPRDLNGDGHALDHAADYVLLPTRVVLEWRGGTGNRSLTIETLLTPR